MTFNVPCRFESGLSSKGGSRQTYWLRKKSPKPVQTRKHTKRLL